MLHHDLRLTKSKTINKYNYLIIITDQQRHDAVGYVNPIIKTPNLDKLASKSTVFTHAFAQSPQCQPSRASIWTGRYPTAHKVWWNETFLSLNEQTIANLFRDAGYKTGYFGKFHVENADTPPKLARHFGFDDNYLMEDWAHFITKPYQSTEAGYTQTVRNEFYGPMSNKTWTGSLSSKSLHHDEVITDNAIKFMQRCEDPYFLVVSYHGPHPPYAAPAEFSALYDKSAMTTPSIRIPNLTGHMMNDEEWRELKVQYYGAISWIDDNIGRLLRQTKDTVIVFLSDHGDMLGDHGHFSKGIYAYDGNTRIPMLIHIPNQKAAKYEHLVQSIDMFPTLCNLAKISVPGNVQGKSLLSHLHAQSTVNYEIVSMLCFIDRLRMIRTKEWKYWIVGRYEYLFDLNNDINECNNLVVDNKNPELLNHARFRLLKKLIECEDPYPLPKPR